MSDPAEPVPRISLQYRAQADMTETTTSPEPTLLWLRRDLRLSDHPGWVTALKAGGPVIPVFILDPLFERYGAAPKWRMGESLADLARTLEVRGSRLILRRGDALDVLTTLIKETGAGTVVWSRQYEPEAIARDTAVKAVLCERGITAKSVNSTLLFEPWEAATKSGGPYKVYSPFWREVGGRTIHPPIPMPGDLSPPADWPVSDGLETWSLDQQMRRGAAIVAQYACVGEDKAQARLERFAVETLGQYLKRDFPGLDVCSGLSENLTYGEISPRQIWTRIKDVSAGADKPLLRAATKFLKELVWREFAYHLMYHTPELVTGNWRVGWDTFPWQNDGPEAEAWRRGQTGIDMVDAAMRELYVTGIMHNRARMLAASFLTKHLMTHWRVGEAWFADCLIDWDPASNAMGWQWTAGSGPDAAPYFRVFNPELQAEKFDPKGSYRDRFLPWRSETLSQDAANYYQAVPVSWGLTPDEGRPATIVGLKEGRIRALDAWAWHKEAREKEQEDA